MKIDIVEERKSFSDDFVNQDYENYTKILLAAVVTAFITLIILWSFNKRDRRKYLTKETELATSDTCNNIEVIWEYSDENDKESVGNQNDKESK